CQAALPPLYQDEVMHHILRVDPAPIPIDDGDNLDAAPPIYEMPVLSENTGFLPDTESHNDELVIGKDRLGCCLISGPEAIKGQYAHPPLYYRYLF
ncbi:jg25760, partial [Pararge aegeria aegeria]